MKVIKTQKLASSEAAESEIDQRFIAIARELDAVIRQMQLNNWTPQSIMAEFQKLKSENSSLYNFIKEDEQRDDQMNNIMRNQPNVQNGRGVITTPPPASGLSGTPNPYSPTGS